MIQLNCILGLMTDTVDVPDQLKSNPEILSEKFSEGSLGDIQLKVDTHFLDRPRAHGVNTSYAYDLHLATRELTGNSSVPISNIAVLFADTYNRFPPAFGLMFDRGFDTPDDPSDSPWFISVPREGCAVFLGAIKAYRNPGPDYSMEALFTTVHELGHLFNLQHKGGEPTFMATSLATSPYPPTAYHFDTAQQDWLRRCSTSSDVRPGGSPFSAKGDQDNQDFIVSQLPNIPGEFQNPDFGLEIWIDMHRREFWRFEPVELEITVRVASGVERSFTIPDVIDPGYEYFSIWIETPSGERHKYQSPRRYCYTGQLRVIAPKAPFHRDISIFGGSGGYTFKGAGIHRIWCELTVSRQAKFRSNTVEVNVLSLREGGKIVDSVRGILEKPGNRKLLYHRLDRSRGSTIKELAAFCQQFSQFPAVATVKYAIGRALLAEASREPKGKKRGRLESRGVDFLQEAIQDVLLSPHQRHKAEQLVKI